METSIYILNAFVIGLFTTWFIPVAIRNPKTGEYKGFNNKTVYIQFLLLVLFESNLLISQLGFSYVTAARIAFCVGLTFALALLFVSMTQKQLFGTEFKMENKNQPKQ